MQTLALFVVNISKKSIFLLNLVINVKKMIKLIKINLKVKNYST